MKAADAKRVAIMVAALNDLWGARKDLKREKPKTTANRRTIRIEFGDSGYLLKTPEWTYRIDFDAPTMRLIMDAAEKILRDELTKLGVNDLPTEPPKKK